MSSRWRRPNSAGVCGREVPRTKTGFNTTSNSPPSRGDQREDVEVLNSILKNTRRALLTGLTSHTAVRREQEHGAGAVEKITTHSRTELSRSRSRREDETSDN
ncbi:unnamed protein product, partial [Amoebophrya sp. A120]|eukprot:GSA120T00016324001.1